MKIYQAINAVQGDLAKVGISKDSKNQSQGYAFRGIDAVYGAVAPLLAKHGLCILPRVTHRDCVERVNQKGTALFYVTVAVEFDLVCAEDGSKHTVIAYGEAMDSGDKATNKAMSAAYKYACLQTFCIPTEGDNDADAQTHEVKSTAMVNAENEAAKAAQDAQYLKDHLKACEAYKDSVSAIVEAITVGNLSKAAEAWCELDEITKRQLWFAPTKGGKAFTTKEREILRSSEFTEACKHFKEKE